jgi:hypothetical protein
MGIKINLGSGFKRYEGFVNLDDDPLVEPDFLINLDDVNIKLPFEDNSVEEIKAEHILEHIGDGFIPLMQELYRVSEHGCIFDIIVPHHFHEVYYGDPTHKRPITVNSMYLFSKSYCKKQQELYNSCSGMSGKFNIDFEMSYYEFEYDDFYKPMILDFLKRKEEGNVSQEEDFAIQRLCREANNVVINTIIKMVAVK